MMIFTATEVRRLNQMELSQKNGSENDLMRDLFGALFAVSETERRLSYYTEGKRLTDEEINALNELGYSVRYNTITGCYDIAW